MTSVPHRTKFDSRKWKLAQRVMAMIFLVPVLYKYLQISDDVTLTTLAMLFGIGTVYTGANMMIKKWGVRDE